MPLDYFVQTACPAIEPAMLAFLKERENFSLFLLGNFESYGSHLGPALFSGNFKVVFDQNQNIVAVFCLTRSGNLLVESKINNLLFQQILSSCLEEKIPIEGLLGSWDFCRSFWDFLKEKQIIQRDVFSEKQVLFSTDLNQKTYPATNHVRLLKEKDIDSWIPMRIDYLKESGLPNHLSKDELAGQFLEKVEKKVIWGLFIEEELVSIAELNAKAFDLGQVGGVYTPPKYRKKGYAKSVMRQLLHDAQTLHQLRKIIIFTGETNLPAQKVYKSLGVSQQGFFALFFGSPP